MTTDKFTTLFNLQSIIKSRLEGAMPLACWVTAEISELSLHSTSGHCYIKLVEKGSGSASQSLRARASAVIWRNLYGMISHYFKSETGSDLAVGMKVLLKVEVSYNEMHGISLVVSDIDPSYTLGDVEQQRQLTIAKLETDGVYQMNQQLELPHVVQRIAVISSIDAAGYQDFIDEIEQSQFALSTTLFDAFMQGEATERSVIAALGRVAKSMDNFDVVVLIRGGGAQSDLSAFDSYRLCNHIAQFPLPIITGIGHERDHSVADLVAHTSLKTPTAVATHLLSRLETAYLWLEELETKVVEMARGKVRWERGRLREVSYSVSKLSDRLTHQLEIKLQRLELELGGRVVRLVERERARLEMVSRVIHNQEPERILSLGFAIVRSEGTAVKDASTLRQGTKLDITLARGGAEVSVERVIDRDNKTKK